MAALYRACRFYPVFIEPDNLIREGDMRSIVQRTAFGTRALSQTEMVKRSPLVFPWKQLADPVAIFKNGGLQEKDRWHALADLGLDRNALLKNIRQQDSAFYLPSTPSKPCDGEIYSRVEIAMAWVEKLNPVAVSGW